MEVDWTFVRLTPEIMLFILLQQLVAYNSKPDGNNPLTDMFDA